MTTHDRLRRAITRHGLSEPEIIREMQRQGLCPGNEAERVARLLAGGKSTMGVALAIITLIAAQNCATRQ